MRVQTEVETDEQGNFLRETVETKDGLKLLIRPAAPGDRQGLEKMFRSCSSQTLYTRFLSPGLGVPLRYLDRLMIHKPPRILSIVAVAEAEARIVALINFVETEPQTRGEIAIVVVDDFQNRGLGTAMLNCLFDVVRAAGVKKFIADIDAGNRRVFHLIERSGLPAKIGINQGVAHAEVDMKRGD